MFIDGPESLGLFVDYCDVIISCLDSNSDGTHSLQRIPWRAIDVLLVSQMNTQNLHLHRGWPEDGFSKCDPGPQNQV